VRFPRDSYLSVSTVAIFSLLAASGNGQTEAIRVLVQEGEGAINNIKEHRAKDPVVQVLHEDGEPAVGATVTFQLPDNGPSGTFGDDSRMVNVQTDEMGQAVGRGLHPNRTAGRFQIRVTASYHGQTVSTAITQINAEPASAGGGGRGKMLLILALVGGGAAGGLAAALGHKSAGSSAVGSPATNPATVLTPGSPSIQPPH